MRIGIDARLLDYRGGGIARYTAHLVSALAALASGHTLVALRARRPQIEPPPLAADESRALLTPPHHRWERWSLPWELRTARLDLLHCPDFICPRPAGWRSVITVHDLAYLRLPGLLTGQSQRYYGGIRRAVREAHAIIAVSQATAQDLVELAHADPAKITVIYEAPDPALGPMDKSEAAEQVRARFGVEGPFVLFVGTIEPRKNLPALVQAFGRLRRDFPVRLVVAGASGWLSAPAFAALQAQARTDAVMFLGAVAPADLRPLYCAAEVLALPSLYEGFGLPAVEAMACGVPVVAANTGALPEVVGQAAVLVRPDDPSDIAEGLGWVLGNPAFRQALVTRGLERAASFSWERAARETLAVYERVVGQ